MAPACSRCHQLGPVHLSGAGWSHTDLAQHCTGGSREQHKLQPSLTASAKAVQEKYG